MLPPSYVPPGQPPNAPIRKSRKTAGFIVNEDNSSDDVDNVPLARPYTKNKKTGQKRGAPEQNGEGAVTPPPQKRKKTPQTAAAKKSFKIMKQWSKDEGPTTPPQSDDDDLLVIDGESYIREGGFTDDEKTEEYIEPPRMDKITT